MLNISIIKETKDYVTVRIPRLLAHRAGFISQELTEAEALRILREGMKEYRTSATKRLSSLRSLRGNGHRV